MRARGSPVFMWMPIRRLCDEAQEQRLERGGDGRWIPTPFNDEAAVRGVCRVPQGALVDRPLIELVFRLVQPASGPVFWHLPISPAMMAPVAPLVTQAPSASLFRSE